MKCLNKERTSHLDRPTGVDEAVGALEVSVRVQMTLVQEVHALDHIHDERLLEAWVQFEVIVHDDVLNSQCDPLLSRRCEELTCKLPLWQYLLTSSMIGGTNTQPTNTLRLSWMTSLICNQQFCVFSVSA